MFNAYYDARKYLKFKDQALIRIMAFIQPPNVLGGPKPFCQFWFNDVDDPIVSEVYDFLVMWPDGWGLDDQEPLPYLVTCLNPLISLGLVPTQVSLVENQCDVATNIFDIFYNLLKNVETERKELAICAKLYNFQDDTNLDFKDDKALELIEWIETQLILGVDKIIFHVRDVHAEMYKVLKFYATQGKVDIEYVTMPDGVEAYYLKKDIIGFNDCLYKNMYRFKYLLPIEVDEIIVPARLEDKTLPDLLKTRVIPIIFNSNPNGAVNFIFRTAFFFQENNKMAAVQPEVPNDFKFLQHVYRAANFSQPGSAKKSIINADWATVIFDYHAHHCFRICHKFEVSDEDAVVQHYSKHGCGENFSLEECEAFRKNSTKDITLWKYKDDIIRKVRKTVADLKVFGEKSNQRK